MRLKALLALLGVALMLLALAGCDGNETPTGPTGFGVTGTVTDLAGAPVAGATISLRNAAGQTIASATSITGGTFTINNVPAGTYTVVTSGTGFVTTVNGTVVVNNNITGQQVTAAMPSELTQESIPTPTSTQGTLLVYAIDPFTEEPVDVTVSVAGQQATGTSPVAVGPIDPGIYDVTITNTETVVANDVQIQANALTVLRVDITPATGGFTVSGNVQYTDGSPAALVGVQLLQSGNVIKQALANTSGDFTVNNVPAGTYQVAVIRSVSGTPTLDFIPGSLTVNGDTNGVDVVILTQTQLASLIGTEPPAGSPTLVALAETSGGLLVPVTVTAQGQTFTGDPDVVTSALTAGTTTVTVTPQGGPTQTFMGVPLANGRITVIRVVQPAST